MGLRNIWIQVDETTDVEGRYIANIVVGAMDPNEFSCPHLLASRELQSTNHATISRLVNEAMGILWPDCVHHERVLLLLSDAAPYMVKAGKALKVFYPNLVHVTCLAHALHRVAESIRDASTITNSLVSNVRKIFVKAPTRVQLYKERYPDIRLPPEPILTRWGTWLDAAMFYAEHFEKIKSVVMDLDPSEALAIRKAQATLQDPALPAELAYLKVHFGQLGHAITSLEKRELAMGAALDIVSKIQTSMADVEGGIGEKAKLKLHSVLQKNPGFQHIKSISQALRGEVPDEPLQLAPDLCACFKNAPITSVEVERSFSSYKVILADNRRRMTTQHLQQLLISHCNSPNL